MVSFNLGSTNGQVARESKRGSPWCWYILSLSLSLSPSLPPPPFWSFSDHHSPSLSNPSLSSPSLSSLSQKKWHPISENGEKWCPISGKEWKKMCDHNAKFIDTDMFASCGACIAGLPYLSHISKLAHVIRIFVCLFCRSLYIDAGLFCVYTPEPNRQARSCYRH